MAIEYILAFVYTKYTCIYSYWVLDTQNILHNAYNEYNKYL